MRHVVIFAFLAGFLIISSCSKDNNSDDIQQTDPYYGYIPIYPGNYWVYEHYQIDGEGNETLLDHYDSLVITGSTTINGHSYMVFQGTWMSGPDFLDTVMMLRDSTGYYVDPSGNIHMAEDNFTDTLAYYSLSNNNTGDTLYQSWYMLETDPSSVSVGAGSFETVNFRGTILTNNPNPEVDTLRYKNQLYSKNVGQVLDTYFYLASALTFERRLVKYFVDPNSAVH